MGNFALDLDLDWSFVYFDYGTFAGTFGEVLSVRQIKLMEKYSRYSIE